MDDIFYMKRKLPLTDIFGTVGLIVLVVVIWTGIIISIRKDVEHKRSLEASGCLIKSDDGREYELGKVKAFGHEYITFRDGSSALSVVHSPECPCHNKE